VERGRDRGLLTEVIEGGRPVLPVHDVTAHDGRDDDAGLSRSLESGTSDGGDVLRSNDQWRPDVEVSSPDGSVRIKVTVSGNLAVDIGNLDRHSEVTLARQVRAVVRIALARLQDLERGDVAQPRTPAPRPRSGS
jgi:hypothetical protein